MNRLSPDILSRIIQFVPCEHDTDAQSIVVLTHSCRYWREFVISTPWNWTLISSRSKGLAVSSLHRAKAEPLEIHLDMNQVRGKPGFSNLINPYIKNTKSLHFSNFKTVKDLTQTLPNFPQSMSALQSLTLDGGHKCSVERFGSLAPTLRCLKLSVFPLHPSFLRLRDLTELALKSHYFTLHLDALLDFLEENRSLESVTLDIRFEKGSLRNSQRQAAIENRLRYLSVCGGEMDIKAMVSNIALQRGAHLEIISDRYTMNDILSGLPTAHLLNLSSPIFMEYQYTERSIRLVGPNGSFSYLELYYNDTPSAFVEFPLLPLTNVREVHLLLNRLRYESSVAAFNVSFFPALETLAVDRDIYVSRLLSGLFSNPSFPPSLKTLAFLNCSLSGDFMEELAQFASDRRKTTSAWLRRVVIVDSKVDLPSTGSMDALGKHVPIVDVRVGKELPTDLA